MCPRQAWPRGRFRYRWFLFGRLVPRGIVLEDRERDEFLALLNRPPSVKPNLRSLLERGSVLPRE